MTIQCGICYTIHIRTLLLFLASTICIQSVCRLIPCTLLTGHAHRSGSPHDALHLPSLLCNLWRFCERLTARDDFAHEPKIRKGTPTSVTHTHTDTQTTKILIGASLSEPHMVSSTRNLSVCLSVCLVRFR